MATQIQPTVVRKEVTKNVIQDFGDFRITIAKEYNNQSADVRFYVNVVKQRGNGQIVSCTYNSASPSFDKTPDVMLDEWIDALKEAKKRYREEDNAAINL